MLEKSFMKNKLGWALLLMISLISACTSASGELNIESAWARPALKGENSAIYFVIKNHTSSSDALMNASTDIASTAEAHMSMQNDQGVVSMQMQEAVQIPTSE